MKCEKCSEREATFFYSTDINGKKSERHLCAECAQAEGFGALFSPAGVFDRAFDTMIDDFFSPMRSFMPLSSFDFFGSGLRSIMAPAMPRLHIVLGEREQTPSPIGEESEAKIPREMDESVRLQREKAALKAQLEEAVSAEDYEKAIILRDKLREMEK